MAETRRTARYRELAEELRTAVLSGVYGAGGRLPSEGMLAETFGVSRGTVRQALAVLRTEGVVTSRRGSRRVVLGEQPRVQSFAELSSFTRWARSLGEEPGGSVIRTEWRAADAVESERLRLAAGARVLWVLRLRTLDGAPVMVERTVYPEPVGELVAAMPPDAVSVTELLEDAGVVLADAEHTLDLATATTEDALLLGCRADSPLLRERRRSSDPGGTPVEWSEDRYLPGTVAFTVHNSLATTALSRTRATAPSDAGGDAPDAAAT